MTRGGRYLLSPEFQRHVWLRFSWLRLMAVPVFVLCACYALMTYYGDKWPEELLDKALMIYYVLIVAWGNYEAANVLREEVRGNTWDFQRMSPVSPAAMIFGKLFGATSYVWYAALPVLAVILFAWSHRPEVMAVYNDLGRHVGDKPLSPSFMEAFYAAFFLIVAGVAGHALTFLISFDGMVGKAHLDPRNRQPRTLVAFLAGMAVSHAIYISLGKGFIRSQGNARARQTVFEELPHINWYNLEVPAEIFFIAAAFFLLGWIFLGIYRLARAELMYRLTPAGWFFGVAALSFFVAGLVFDPEFLPDDNLFGIYKKYAFLFYLFLSTLGATYYAMLAGASDLRKYERFRDALLARRWRDVFENMHQWVASGILVLAAYLAFVLYLIRTGMGADLGVFNVPMFVSLITSLLLFVLRDGIVIHVMASWRGERPQTFERIAYYVAAYFLIPAVHLSIAIKNLSINPTTLLGFSQQTAVFHPMMYAGWYYPTFFAQFSASLLPVIVQIALILGGVAFYRRLRRRAAPAEAPA